MSVALIPFRLSEIGGQPVRAVDSRELHRLLEVQTRHRDWIKRRVEEAHLVEHFDFEKALKVERVSKRGPIGESYLLTSDACKHISLMEGTEIGHRIRREFIEAEKRDRESRTSPRRIAGVEIGIELENHDHQRTASRTLAGTATSTADVIGKFVGISRAISGREPKDVRQMGRLLGFKSRECRSAPEVWRAQGAVEAPMHSALCLMIALGVPPSEAYRQAGPARDAINALRGVFIDAGADPSVFARIPRDEFDRLLSEAADRKRAADRQMSLFGA